MNIEQTTLLEILGSPGTRFAIPVFQRVYSWNSRQCEELFDDAIRAGREARPHFMGMVLCADDAQSWRGARQLNVIDGQQRLTTLTLLLAALRAKREACGQIAESDDGRVPCADEIEERFLVVDGQGARGPKLALSKMDRDTLSALAGAADPPEDAARRLIDNYLVFAGKMEAPDFDVEVLWKGLEQLEVALVMLAPEDSPQLVFESLNSKGMPLSTADRVRNLLIASTEGDEQERLYANSWLPLEKLMAQADPAASVADALHAWLAERYRDVHLVDKSEAYGVFKTCLRNEYGSSLEALLEDVRAFAERYLADAEFREAAQKNAEEWLAGKPKELISELKLFGD